MEAGEETHSDFSVETFIVHCEGDTDAAELYSTPTYEELSTKDASVHLMTADVC
jgi:hypothetical protein